jgi:ATP phosphoribosyltransferase regulatory subunit
VFCLIAQALGPAPLRAATGDIGILLAAVDALETTAPRRAALRRHIWRPRRFRALMDRFSGRAPVPASRQAVIAGQLAPTGAPEIGLRSMAEIKARIAALREDAQAGPIPASQVALIDAILDVREAMPYALEQLRDISVDLPAIVPAVARMAQRMQALERRGIDVARLDFEASYGRSTMEYYDGFVFGFYAETRADLPAVASGGRYDALTAVLGQGRSIPAVGGVIRPGLLAELGAGV